MKRYIWCDDIAQVAEYAMHFALSGVTFECEVISLRWRITVLGA